MTEEIIQIKAWGEFFNELVRSSKATDTADIDDLYRKFQVNCEKCGIQFTQETLSKLYLFSPDSIFATVVVVGESKEGPGITAGKCPSCGHSKIKIIKHD